MSTKQLTKPEQYIIRKPFLFWALAVIPSIPFLWWIDSIFSPRIYSLIHPSVIAAGVTIVNGINSFSGTPVNNTWNIHYTFGLISILIFYLIIPFIFFSLFGKWKNTAAEARELTSFRKIYIGLFLSLFFFIGIILSDWIGYVNSLNDYNKMRNTSIRDSYKSMLSEALAEQAFHAREYFYRPVSAGGGGGKFQSFKINTSGIENTPCIKKVSNLFPYNFSKIKYELKTGENDTTLYITANGSQLEVKIKVTPSLQYIIQ